MKQIEQFYAYKAKMENIRLAEFKNYDISKILNCDVWNMISLSNIDIIKRVMAHIICKSIFIDELEDSISESQFLAIEIKLNENNRADNQTIFNNLYSFIRPSKHYVIRKKYKFDLKNIFLRLSKLFRYAKVFQIGLLKNLYLSAQLVMADGLLSTLGAIDLNKTKYLLLFQEHDTISQTCIQFMHMHNIKCITPQHGMPMNRHEDYDQMFFEGFGCDYKLLWNDFTKHQFVSAGVPEDKLFVVGNTKLLYSDDKSIKHKPTNTFGVLLDYPLYENASESNRKLLEIANRMSEYTGLRGVVRLHPVDSKEKYADLVNGKNLTFSKEKATLRDFEKEIDFSLAHITGAIIDLIYDGCFVFIYQNGQNYPIETDDIYKFDSYESLKAKIDKWNENIDGYGRDYKKIIDLYNTVNPLQGHERFFKEVLKHERNNKD